jgi:DNA helicase-2/ATP-dependent DNA helicase PcrA
MSNKIGMPENLKLLSEGDNVDDKLRLLYVAMTRAKHTLYITHSKEKLSYILKNSKEESGKKEELGDELSLEIVKNLQITDTPVYMESEKVLLKRLLENYKMPVTHMTNFLNIGKVGPSKFVEQNLLRFPQAMSSSSAYGSAMHAAMQSYYLYFKKHEEVPSLEKLKEYFENSLLSYGLSNVEYEKYKKSGYENLEIYKNNLETRNGGADIAKMSDMVEYNFANEGVRIDEVHASGKIDKMEFVGDTITVTDLKTGKSFSDWDEKGVGEYDKIKLHFFKYQLAYYKLLIQNSRTYHGYKVNIGKIEFLEYDEDKKINILSLDLGDELCERVSKLSNIVYQKIMNLDFPDTTHWTHDESGEEREVKLKDILEFEEMLLSENQ